jgi:hypothetical protein
VFHHDGFCGIGFDPVDNPEVWRAVANIGSCAVCSAAGMGGFVTSSPLAAKTAAHRRVQHTSKFNLAGPGFINHQTITFFAKKTATSSQDETKRGTAFCWVLSKAGMMPRLK